MKKKESSKSKYFFALGVILFCLLGLADIGLAKKGSSSVYTKEAKIKMEGGKARVDFEETSISGSRKVPLGTVIDQGTSDKSYDFVEVRKNWHEEMVKSASSLDTTVQKIPFVSQGQ